MIQKLKAFPKVPIRTRIGRRVTSAILEGSSERNQKVYMASSLKHVKVSKVSLLRVPFLICRRLNLTQNELRMSKRNFSQRHLAYQPQVSLLRVPFLICRRLNLTQNELRMSKRNFSQRHLAYQPQHLSFRGNLKSMENVSKKLLSLELL